jgi:enamine deaminase RidA (YjgF/YER057c/UK114 family)
VSAPEVLVEGWPPPKGFANGRVGHGKVVHVAGQIGMDAHGAWAMPATTASAPQTVVRDPAPVVDASFVPQFAQALDNVLAVIRAAGGAAEDIAEMTVFVTNMQSYRDTRRELAQVWRERLGKHFPAMALIGVSSLFEEKALVEIQAVAYIGAP